MELKQNEQAQLLNLARASIAQALGQASAPAEAVSPALEQKGGAFVTLHKKGQLRGCIGSFPGNHTLAQIVGQMAQAAAFNDPRFRPLSAEELASIDLEISVLSPLFKADPSQIQVGKHGIYIISARGRGVLLPQVALEHGWDRLTFLEQTCRKAGLNKNAWQDEDVEVYLFTAQVFGEKQV